MSLTATTVLLALWAADPVAIAPQPEQGLAQAVVVGPASLLHTAQIFPAGPAFAPTSPAEQVSQVLSQLRAELTAVESTLADVIKLNVYVTHPSVTTLVERELKQRFEGLRLPAVSFVETGLPDPGIMVAMDAVAVTRRESDKVVLMPDAAEKQPARSGILPVGSVCYISGQAERGDGTVAVATRQTMLSLMKTLQYLGNEPSDVVHIKAFLTPIASATVAKAEIQAAFGEEPCPPLSFVEWDSNLPIEIEMVVAAPPLEGVEPTALPIEYLTPTGMTASSVFSRVTRIHAPRRIYLSGLYAPEGLAASKEVANLFDSLKKILDEADGDLQHLGKATYYVASDETSRELNRQRPQYYDAQRPPAASKAVVAGTGRNGRAISFDMIAVPLP
ncbi:RidA family protein [bacterium]|nr:RidA family protein [bacterium]